MLLKTALDAEKAADLLYSVRDSVGIVSLSHSTKYVDVFYIKSNKWFNNNIG